MIISSQFLLLVNQKVGKSSIFQRYKDNTFGDISKIVGGEVVSKTVTVEDIGCKCRLIGEHVMMVRAATHSYR